MKDTYVLFYLLDKYDDPYLLRNPPDNLGQLLAYWKQNENLDMLQQYADVIEWLQKQGVEVLEPKSIVFE